MTEENCSPSSQVTSTRRNVLIIGQSHTEAVSAALKQEAAPNIKVVNYNRPDEDKYKRGAFDPAMVEKEEKPDILVSMISGNFHNVLGLIEYPIRFNVMNEHNRVGDLDPERINIPYSVLYDYFNSAMRDGFLKILLTLRDLYGVPIYHLCSPPPHPDSDFIRENPGGYFADKVRNGVSPPHLRLMLYQLHSRIFREFCEENGINFVAPPSDAVDENGFLARPCWKADPTHANAVYGAMVVRQIQTLLEGPHASLSK